MVNFKCFPLKQMLAAFCGLLLGCKYVAAQSGYNYARPDIVVGSNAPVNSNIPVSGQTPARPIAAGFPSDANNVPSYPTAVTGYGATGTATQPYAGFSAQPQSQRSSVGVAPTASAGFAGARPTLQTQRPSGGIFGIGQQFTAAGSTRGGPTGTGTGNNLSDDDYDGDFSAIPGIPGVNYPIYAQVPPTSFDCAQQPLPGYYSDIEAQCQVFHICALNRTYSFLCPNGTIFSQETLVCVWWNQYDCVSAPSLYANNAFIYDYGSQGSPSNNNAAGFQANVGQVGFGNGVSGTGTTSRPQSVFQAQTNAVRASNAPVGSSLYGGTGTVRPVLSSNTFVGGQSAFSAGTSTNAQASQSAFPTGTTAVVGNSFGLTTRSDGFPTRLQDNVFPNAQGTSTTANREYLPPSRRQ